MTRPATILTAITASLLGLALYSSLSVKAAGVLLRLWMICSPLLLIVRVSDLRRGLEEGYGRLPPNMLGRLALWAAITGLIFAAALMIFATLAVGALR